MKKIIITGVTGQDGSLMADYLLENTEYTPCLENDYLIENCPGWKLKAKNIFQDIKSIENKISDFNKLSKSLNENEEIYICIDEHLSGNRCQCSRLLL